MFTDDVDHDVLSNEFHNQFRNHHIKKTEKRKKEKLPRPKSPKAYSRLAIHDVSETAPKVHLLGNPSCFAVYATVRSHVQEYNFAESCRKIMLNEEQAGSTIEKEDTSPSIPLPKIIGLGIETVFQLIEESHVDHPDLCMKSLMALLNILEGQHPQGLKRECPAVLDSLFKILLQLSNCGVVDFPSTSKTAKPSTLTSVATSCLISLAVARGDTKQILQTIVSLLECDETHVFQELKNPDILKSLQLSILSILIGRQSLPDWLTYGIPSHAIVDMFKVDFFDDLADSVCALPARSIAADGQYLYIVCGTDLFKIGTGAFGTVRGYVYDRSLNFASLDALATWIGYSNKRLYCHITTQTELQMRIIDPDKLIVMESVCDPKEPESLDYDSVHIPYSFFSDGESLGYISPTRNDGYLVRTLATDSFDKRSFKKEFNIRLVRRTVEACGPGPWDSATELRQIETGFDDEIQEISAGKDFTIILTYSGSLYYCGKGASLGQKVGAAKAGKWLELNLAKSTRFVHCAVGHDGIHAILLAEDWTAYFVGTPKRGEDGDLGKSRKVAKACKPKKVTRMDGHEVRFAACNNGTSAFVTRTGELYMFGKDAIPQFCDPATGFVSSLRGEVVTQVALGKAHSVILTKEGKVYTMGVNNKGQCGRSHVQREDEPVDDEEDWDDALGVSSGVAADTEEAGAQDGFCLPGQHHWKHDQCMVCTVCRECTGYGSACISALRPDRNPGQECGCGVGDAGCDECGSCRACAREGMEDVDVVVIEGAVGGEEFQMPEVYQIRINREIAGDEGNEEAVPEVQFRNELKKPPHLVRIKIKEKEKPLTAEGLSVDVGIGSYLSLDRLNLENAWITQIACGLHHTVLLDANGEVLVFGGNSAGQLGLGDRNSRFLPEWLPFPADVRIVQVAAGSYHTVCLDAHGVVYTAGSNSNDQLGRSRPSGNFNLFWQETMLPIEGIGARLGRRATRIGASGDTTFITLEASLISPNVLGKSAITANKNAIVIIPPPCENQNASTIIIDRRDGSCHQCLGDKQWEVTTSAVVLDPVYQYVWAYEAETTTVKCFNVVASEIRNPEIRSNVALSCAPCALPLSKGSNLHRWQAGINLLACVDTVVSARVQGMSVATDQGATLPSRLKSFSRDEYLCVSRFDSNGGGWAYSNNCAEAIRFSCDTDVLIGGFSLFGGRGEYTAHIKLFDIGHLGGDWEPEGELVAQAEDINYETLPRQKFRALFDEPVRIVAGRWYVAWAMISGQSSDCGSNGQATVLTDDRIFFHFKTSKKSTNGTDVSTGQIPQILYQLVHSKQNSTGIEDIESDPIHILGPDFASNFNPECVTILTSLFTWCEKELAKVVPNLTGSPEVGFKFELLKFVARICIRLMEFSTKQCYPTNRASSQSQMDSVGMAEAVGDVRIMLQSTILIDKDDPPLFQYCDVHDIVLQASNTYVDCFGIFFPTASLKWECLKSTADLVLTKGEGYMRLYMCTIWALWNCRGQLLSIFPVLRNHPHEISGDASLAFVTNSEGGKIKPTNRLLTAQMTLRFETDGLFTRVDWDFWETIYRILQLVDNAEDRYDEMGKGVILHSSILVGRLMEELVSHACGTYSDIESVFGQTIVSTPCRFARTNQSRTWNTGMGSADAVGFFVDQEGVSIFGACIYVGTGSYTYVLDLLEEVEDSESPGQGAQKWVSLATANGGFDAEDCIGDVAEIRFPRPVHIKAGTKYALRLGNHGGRTCNGDGGVSVLRCADGTTFTFSACPLSFNGTNQIRGQLPYILYFRNVHNSDGRQKSKVIVETDARKCALKLGKVILGDSNVRLTTLYVVVGNIRRNHRVHPKETNFHPDEPTFSNIIIPSIASHLQKLAASDLRSCVQILEMIRDPLRFLSDLNIDLAKYASSLNGNKRQDIDWGVHYTWVESSHPYKPATITHYRVTFPSSVKEMTVEFDPRCMTAQDEDILRIFVPFENDNCQWVDNNEEFEYSPYIPAMEKCFSVSWPDKAVILPGNEILFSLETSSDYARAEKPEYFGFRCLVTGYEKRTTDGYQQAELELSHLGGFCAHELIKSHLVLPPVSAEELKTPEVHARSNYASWDVCVKHHTLFSKGVGLEYFPTVQEALDGIVPLRENSKEREFIADFIARTPNTSGERLANWLQPESFVDPEKCELILPKESLKRGKPAYIAFITKDQHGKTVQSPNLVIEMKASPLRRSHDSTKSAAQNGISRKNYNVPGIAPGTSVLDAPFEPTVKDKMRYQAITLMKEYENFSFEELRYLSPVSKRTSESILVRENHNGTYTATWCPMYVGSYHISISVDGYSVPQISAVEVEEAPDGPPLLSKPYDDSGCLPKITFSNKRKFKARAVDSSGLRIRDHPTLQSEQLGIIPLGGIVTFAHEVHNDDGIWVKLDDPSFREYCKNVNVFQREGWCLQFNQHLGKTFLFPLEPPKPLPGVQSDSTVRKSSEPPSTTAENSNSAKVLRLNGGLGPYIVAQCAPSGHNARTRPCLRSPPVGILALGTQFRAVDECYNNDGFWLKLDRETQKRHCFTKEGECWSLAVGAGDVVYLEKNEKGGGGGPPGFDFSEASRAPPRLFPSKFPAVPFGSLAEDQGGSAEEQMGSSSPTEAQRFDDDTGCHHMVNSDSEKTAFDGKDATVSPSLSSKLTKRANSEVGDEPTKVSGRSRSSSTFGALQKWLQMGTESLSGSHGPSTSGSKSSHSMLEVSKSLVKEGIHALSSGSNSKQHVPILTNSATQTSPTSEALTFPHAEFQGGMQFNIGASLDLPASKGFSYELQKVKAMDKRKSRSHSRGTIRERKPSTSPRPDERIRLSSHASSHVKDAIGPGDAQSIRAVFGAMIWFTGITHDAMVTASYLKFLQSGSNEESPHGVNYPDASTLISTQPTPVSTEVPPTSTLKDESDYVAPVVVRRKTLRTADRVPSQRHSIEATSAPWLPSANSSVVASEEPKSLSESQPNGDLKKDLFGPRNTDSVGPNISTTQRSSESKKPPAAMAALQKIWNHIRKNCNEAMLQELFRGLRYKIDGPMKAGPIKLKRDRKNSKVIESDGALLSRNEKPKEVQSMGRSFLLDVSEDDEFLFEINGQQCEICQVRFDRKGKSRKLYFGFSTLCDNCIDCQLKVKRQQSQPSTSSSAAGVTAEPTIPKTSLRKKQSIAPSSVYSSILSNALFLLQMLNTPEGAMAKSRNKAVSSEFETGDTFYCLEALGVAEKPIEESKVEYLQADADCTFFDKEADLTEEDKGIFKRLFVVAVPPITKSPINPPTPRPEDSRPRHRKASNGDHPTDDTGHNLLSRPSPALQKFLENSETYGEKEALLKLCGNVLSFVVEKHDLVALKLFLFETIRITTCRSFGMQCFAWLMRNVSQPIGLHDLLWWYASALQIKMDFSELEGDVKYETEEDGWWQQRVYPFPDCPVNMFPHLSESFYFCLQTMSDVMKYLPIGSPLLEMAVKCWGVRFHRRDHRFLHKCKIFRNLSQILSQFDGEAEWSKSSVSVECHDGESDNAVELTTCYEDLTPNSEVTVSSRMALSSSLTDDSTETFWESGDEDRSRTKHIFINCNSEAQFKVAAIYLDNVKDNLYRVTSIAARIGARQDDFSVFGTVEVDPKFLGWIWFPIRGLVFDGIPADVVARYVQFDLKGAESNVRVRQVKVLGYSGEARGTTERSLSSSVIARQKCERETIRIFRLLSSEVFGKLLSERKHGEDDEGNDLQEHVVGILFSRNKLTHLQKQVCSHIVAAIHRETVKIKEEFSATVGGTVLEVANESIRLIAPSDRPKVADRYCFEMLSLVLALAGSKVGRSYLSRQSNLIQDLVQLLHAGTPRIQRQVLQVLRKILSEITPSAFMAIVGSGTSGKRGSKRGLGILDLFLGVICKALQMKARSTGANNGRSRVAKTINLSDTFSREDFPTCYWFLHGEVEPALAFAVVKLVNDLTEGVFSNEWATVAKEAIAESILYIPTIPLENRSLEECLCSADFWISVSSLCVLHPEHAESLSYPDYMKDASGHPTCINHDDGDTLALIQCVECGDLCGDCDRILHLPKKAWSHVRKICQEEEKSISLDLHEGCGRIKLFWLMALADSSTLKALVEFRQGIPRVSEKDSAPLQAVGKCRFCGRSGSNGPLALGNVCGDPDCQEFFKTACEKILACQHLCGGVKGEQACLPCLHRCGGYSSEALKQDAEDMCMICFTDNLGYAPAVQLQCGHVFHHHCCLAVLQKKWAGPRITFNFSTCPVCKAEIKHELLDSLLIPIRELYEDVKRKAMMRLEYEGMSQADAIASPGGQYYQNPGQYALDRYAYYLCFKCKKPYFGGDARCDIEIQPQFNPEELVCGGCSDVAQAQLCPKHGTDYLEYKCRYCCSVAVFFCFGTTHFCNGCHDDFQRVTTIPKSQLPSCPAGPRARQLEVAECPLHVTHPPTGEEYALGCGICRNAHTF